MPIAMPWLAPEPVPLTLISDHPDTLPRELSDTVTDPIALATTTATPRRRAMARVTPDSLQLHRVPAALLRARTHPAHANGEWASTAVRLLRAAVPADPWNNPSAWPLWRQLLPHVLVATDPTRTLEPVIDRVEWLLDRAATYLQTRGEPHPARPLFERAYHHRRERLGNDHPDTLTSASNLAADLAALGHHDQARTLDEDTLTRRRARPSKSE
jgi:Tetratricopeptide repeat